MAASPMLNCPAFDELSGFGLLLSMRGFLKTQDSNGWPPARCRAACCCGCSSAADSRAAWLCSLAYVGQRAAARGELHIQLQVKQRGPLARQRSAEGGFELFGAHDRPRLPAVRTGQCREIGVRQVAAADPAGVVPLLMHADRAVAAVVDHHADE